MKQKRIYIQQWLDFKPYQNQTLTDSYYLQLSNEVKHAITTNTHSLVLQRYLQPQEIDMLSCFLTSYFEDLIAETQLWNSFIKKHKELYNKQLPFYFLEEYYEDEINLQDVSFLIWYFMNTIQEEKFIAPFNDFIVETAEKVMVLFDTAWDHAPENEYLKQFYQIDETETDFYEARAITDIVLFQSYLFYPDTTQKIRATELALAEDPEVKDNIQMFLNDNRDENLHKTHTNLLSLTGKEWAAEIIGNNHPLKNDFLNISQRIKGYFFYKGQDDENVFIEHIASGKKFNLIKKSFDNGDILQTIDTILFMGIVKWKNEWWFSGIFFQQPFNADLILDEKNSQKSRMEVNFLDHQTENVDEVLAQQYNAFLAFNDGLPIAFMPSEKIDDFTKNYTEYFNASLNISAKEQKQAKQRAKDNGFFGTEEQAKNYKEISKTALVFFNQKSGLEIASAVNSAFPLANNPYFSNVESEDHILRLLMDESLSVELTMYCIDNCKSDLPFFNENVGKAYFNDIDFLLRFWKKENYHSKPSITFTGQKQ
ncbi:MAG: hypothetical protein COB15_07540 [Flavobacteriales bacterium]|nr:MAG: hypothetical protein COB15_07540 [Flavobacteriales bacterium]